MRDIWLVAFLPSGKCCHLKLENKMCVCPQLTLGAVYLLEEDSTPVCRLNPSPTAYLIRPSDNAQQIHAVITSPSLPPSVHWPYRVAKLQRCIHIRQLSLGLSSQLRGLPARRLVMFFIFLTLLVIHHFRVGVTRSTSNLKLLLR